MPIINPLGSALIFLGLVGPAPAPVYRTLARKIAINNIVFLGVIEVLGSAILKFFGISLPIVQVSGGLVITAIGWSLLNEKSAEASARNKRSEANACMDGRAEGDAELEAGSETGAEAATEVLAQKAFYPFTFPITSGPGTLVVTLTLSAHAADPSWSTNILGHLGLLIAIAAMSVMVYFCYAYAPRITRAIAPSTVHGILRVMAFIVLSIGVQIGWNGFASLWAELPKH